MLQEFNKKSLIYSAVFKSAWPDIDCPGVFSSGSTAVGGAWQNVYFEENLVLRHKANISFVNPCLPAGSNWLRGLGVICVLAFFLQGCGSSPTRLSPVTHAQFAAFVKETGYRTDAEKYGWSIVQLNVFQFKTMPGANWRKPDGVLAPADDLPVTQVSYNDAVAYCNWAGKRLPTYDEYWELIAGDDRLVVSENRHPISSVEKVNVLGNVWDLTQLAENDSTRLAGGSLFCSVKTCHGTVKSRRLFVDQETGNTHIGFSVVE